LVPLPLGKGGRYKSQRLINPHSGLWRLQKGKANKALLVAETVFGREISFFSYSPLPFIFLFPLY